MKIWLSVALVALLGVGIFFLVQVSSGNKAQIFPDQLYLESSSSLNGMIAFKARVVKEIGRDQDSLGVHFVALETVSGKPLELVVVLKDKLMEAPLLPGQLYLVSANATKGNLVAEHLEKY